MVEHVYMASEQDARCLATSRCVVSLTFGILLDPSQEEFLSLTNTLKVRLNHSRVRENVVRIIGTHLLFALGTDAYYGFLYREVRYAMELGVDPITAIQGVTPRAARVYRLEDRIGKLEDSVEADIIVVEGNSLEDVSRLSQIGLVMKDGVVHKQL